MLKAAVPAVLLLLAMLLAACGGEGPSGPSRPSEQGPLNIIAFGGRDTSAEGRYALYLINADASGLRSLEPETAPVSSPVWSPAGDRIAYFAGAGDGAGPATLRVYDFAARASFTVSEQALSSPDGPAISWRRDGTRLAFAEAIDGGRLREYDIDTEEVLDFGGLSGVTPAWSPSRDELAFVRQDTGGATTLFLVGADGQDERTLLAGAGVVGDPRWSPDGERIVLWSAPVEEPEARRLLVVDVGGDAVEVTDGSYPAWSPDGEQLAYSGPSPGGAPAVLNLYLVPADGGEPLTLSEASTRDVGATWSPDGNQIVYAAQADPQTAFLCLIQFEPEQRDCLDLGNLVPRDPAWSPH